MLTWPRFASCALLIGAATLVGACAAGSDGAATSTAGATDPESFTAAGVAERVVDRIPEDSRITEASGMTLSGRDSDALLIHNDSGDGAYVYRVGPDGEPWGRITLRGVEPRDWEAMTRIGTGPASRVIVGDIGDNRSSWPNVELLEFAEPEGRADVTVVPTKYRFEFEDGPRDAEALMISPRTGRIYVVSKRAMGATIYLAPKELSTSTTNVLRRWREAPAYVTDASFNPDGTSYALRTYTKVHVVDAASGSSAIVDVPLQPQGESLTWTDDGSAVLIGSEGEKQPILRVDVPR